MNNFGDLNDILTIYWQFLAVFVFFAVILYFWQFFGRGKAVFPYFPQFKGRLYWTNNYIQISLFSPKYIKCQVRHFASLYFDILMFHPTSLFPVEEIMTTIRAIEIDHGPNPDCSSFGKFVVLDILHMTNYSNLGLYIGVLGFSMTFMIFF